VVPAGTARLERVMVAHEDCAFMAAAAPVAPEKVHAARFSAGAATADAASEENSTPSVRATIVKKRLVPKKSLVTKGMILKKSLYE